MSASPRPRANGYPPRMPARVPAAALLLCAAVCACGAGCHRFAGHAANERGKRLYAAGRVGEAREEFRRAALDDPADPDYRHNFAAAAARSLPPGSYPAAVESLYRQALSLNPDHQPAVHKLAGLLADTGRGAEAEALVVAWAARRPEDPRPLVELAAVRNRIGNPAGAEAALRRAVAVAPDDGNALANLGQLLERAGRRAEAKRTYAAALEADWNQPEVAARLAALGSRPQSRGPAGPRL